jgi:glycogen debranching enzyme
MLPENIVNVIDGATFLVSDRRGNVRAEGEERRTDGLFYRDMRHLSTFELVIEGGPVELLSTNDTDYYGASFFLAVDTGARRRFYRQPEVSVTRHRNLFGVLREETTVRNHSRREIPLRLEFRFAADFADLFEVKDDLVEKTGLLERSCAGNTIHFSYTRDDFRRGTEILLRPPDGPPVRLDCPNDADEPVRATVSFNMPPKSDWTLALDIWPQEGREALDETHRRRDLAWARGRLRKDLERWRHDSPKLYSSHLSLTLGWRRSVDDLAALRCRVDDDPEEVIAAGLPWFMALFGRDSLIGAYQTLMLQPDLSRGVLRALARRQAQEIDAFTDAQPGKILHELRHGELTRFGESPHRPYYGTVDATPLFLILLHETWRWTADGGLVRELEGVAREALRWISDYGDSDGDGYVDYIKHSEAGLDNQGWKDSHNAILFSDGTLARGPIALCEVQGYVYDAWLRTAELAERIWGDGSLAADLRLRAAALKRRFEGDFWMEDRNYYALALDGEGCQVDSVTSNAGHLLWSGIVSERRAGAVVERLMDPDALFSGWGIRTMSKEDGGYNPIEYHNGTVWPHDNSLIACGLHRYGYQNEAARVASALIDAAAYFDHRLPEVFAGYDRTETGFPVEYPTASSPQAWAAGTIPLLVRLLLGLEPDSLNHDLTPSPMLPEELPDLRIEGVPAFGKRFDVATD